MKTNIQKTNGGGSVLSIDQQQEQNAERPAAISHATEIHHNTMNLINASKHKTN